jgi:hypothetical protein
MHRISDISELPRQVQDAVAAVDRTLSFPLPSPPLGLARSRKPRIIAPFKSIPAGWVYLLDRWGVGLEVPKADSKSVRVLVELLSGRFGQSLEGCFGTFGQALGTAWMLRADTSPRVTLAFLVRPPGPRGKKATASFFQAPAVAGDSAETYCQRIIARLKAAHRLGGEEGRA